MAFHLYKREQREVENKPKGGFEQVKEVTLGGKTFGNLWKQQGNPLNQGWHITRDNLINILTDGKGNSDSNAILIDWDPRSRKRIGLVEILNLYAYTHSFSRDNPKPDFTPVMLKLRDIYYDEFNQKKEPKEIETIKKKFRVEGDEDYLNNEAITFLYLLKDTFRFGIVGRVNGAIYKEAREYFRTFF